MADTTDQEAFRDAVAEVPSFVYRNWLTLTVVSVVWFVVSIPLVTLGPATLGAFVAIQGLRSDRNRIDRGQIVEVLRTNGVASVLFSGLPVVFLAIAATYGVTALQQGSIAGEFVALIAAYAGLYLALALIPTFVAMARETDAVSAFRYGIRWLVDHPTPALAMGLLSILLLALTAVLTIGFVLLFAGLTFSLQITVVETVDRQTSDSTVSETASPC